MRGGQTWDGSTKKSLVGKVHGKGKIVAAGPDEVFGVGEEPMWVPFEPCRGPSCVHPNAAHLIKQMGEMKGYCTKCAIEAMAGERARKKILEETTAAEAASIAALRSYGKGTIISAGVDDGEWKAKPRCAAPDCADPAAWFLVKQAGPWRGHCTPCVVARVADGRPPASIPARDASLDSWKTRKAPGAEERAAAEMDRRAKESMRAMLAETAEAQAKREAATLREAAAKKLADDAELEAAFDDFEAAPPSKEGGGVYDELHDLLDDEDEAPAAAGGGGDHAELDLDLF